MTLAGTFVRALAIGVWTAVGVSEVGAQRVIAPAVSARGTRSGNAATDSISSDSGLVRAPVRNRAPLWAPLASGVVPGSGQLVMREPRGVAYLAAEVYEAIQFAVARRDRGRSRNEFKRIALDVARAPFGGGPDGAWPYYESLSEKIESGRYSQSSSTLVPETDTSTFNGKQWENARDLYFLDPNAPPPATDPRYQQALRRYDSTAVHENFRWSWRNQQLYWDIYRGEIATKNRATRAMNSARGIIVANHLLSAVDAIATVRLRRTIGPRGEQRYEATVPWAPFGRGARPIR